MARLRDHPTARDAAVEGCGPRGMRVAGRGRAAPSMAWPIAGGYGAAVAQRRARAERPLGRGAAERSSVVYASLRGRSREGGQEARAREWAWA